MQGSTRDYVPAAGQHWALRFYDPLVQLSGMGRMRDELVERAALRAGVQVLDIGCGTGSLVVALKRRAPHALVTGLDPDPKALALARAKTERAQLSVQLDQGYSDRLPYPDRSFDLVFSSFMFHHLDASEKRATLREVLRVLRPGGVLHLLDFRDDPHGKSPIMRLLHASSLHAKFVGQTESEVESLLTEAGFSARLVGVRRIFFFGALAYYQCLAP